MQDDSLTQPPLPRYRYEVTTGSWRHERTAGGVAGSSSGTSSNRRVLALASDAPESSFDYFLRKSYAVERKADTDAAAKEKCRAGALSHIAEFERQHQQRLASEGMAAAKETSTPEGRVPPQQPAGAAATAPQSAPLSAKGKKGATAGQSFHPIFGLLVDVPLPTTAAALVRVSRGPLLRVDGGASTRCVAASGDPVPAKKIALTLTDFAAFLSLVAPTTMVSEAYVEEQLFSTLPPYDPDSNTVCAAELFTFIARNTFHPSLDRNVAMLFRVFDDGQRGVIAAACLQASSVREWAERNAFGLLRMEWMRFAAALEREEALTSPQPTDSEFAGSAEGGDPSSLHVPSLVSATRPPMENAAGIPKWLTSDMVVILLSSSPRLFSVADTVDLEGSSLRSRDGGR